MMDDIADFIAKGTPLTQFDTTHHFSDGVCIRELKIPAGSLVVGAEHTTNHLTILLKGILHVRIGDEVEVMHAPHTFEASEGTRKVVFAYTDCIVSNIFPTNSTDIDEIEREFMTYKQDRKLLMKELLCQVQ